MKTAAFLIVGVLVVRYLTELKSGMTETQIHSPAVLTWVHGTSDRALQAAIERDDPVEVATLLSTTPRSSIRDSVIERIASDRCSKSLRVFLQKGWSARGPLDDNAPLLCALQLGQKEAVEILLEGGADVNTRDRWGHSALVIAVGALHGSGEMIASLSRHGAKFDSINTFRNRNIKVAPRGIRQERPMTLAAAKGDTELVRKLLLLGANPNSVGGELASPIFAAAVSPHPLEVTKILLEAGANIDQVAEMDLRRPDEDRKPVGTVLYFNFRWERVEGTALHLNAMRNNVETVRFLLDRGADPTKRNKAGKSPLDVAVGESRALLQNAIDARSRQK